MAAFPSELFALLLPLVPLVLIGVVVYGAVRLAIRHERRDHPDRGA